MLKCRTKNQSTEAKKQTKKENKKNKEATLYKKLGNSRSTAPGGCYVKKMIKRWTLIFKKLASVWVLVEPRRENTADEQPNEPI